MSSPKFSPPQMSMWVSYWPRWLNQLLSMTKIPPAMTGVLQRRREMTHHITFSAKCTKPSAQRAEGAVSYGKKGARQLSFALILGPMQVNPVVGKAV